MANGIQMTYYLKINKIEGICYIPELRNIKWNFQQSIQIMKRYGSKNLSEEVGVCEYLDYDYKAFAQLNYDEALQLKQNTATPGVKNCMRNAIRLSENTTRYRNLDIPFCHSSILGYRMFLLKNLSFMIGSIVFGILGDVFGRKKISVIVAILWTLSTVCLSSLPDFGASEIFFVATNCFNKSLDLLTYINLLEISPKKIRFFAVLTFYGRIVVFVFLTRFSDLLNFDWNILLHICFCFALVSLFHCWYIPESPRWLINHSKYKDALEVMKEIIGYVPNEILFEDEGTDTIIYWDIFINSFRYLRKRKIKTMTIMILFSAVVGFIEETQVLRILQSKIDARGAIVVSTSRIVSFFYAMMLFGAFGKKYGLFCTLMSITFVSYVVICFRDSSSNIDIRVNAFLLMTTCSAEMLVYAYLPDLFPTFLRCTTLGMIFFFSSIARIITVELIDWTEVMRTNVYIIFFVISLPGFFILKLPDTTLADLLTTRLFRV
ncbi:hypothetical protein WA026_012817 [Henosepilachna vigintioctopunctata]